MRCIPGSQQAHVSYRNNHPNGGHNKGGHVRDVTVTSKLRSSRKEIEAEQKLNPKVAHLVDTNLDVVAETPVWVEKKEEINDEDSNKIKEEEE